VAYHPLTDRRPYNQIIRCATDLQYNSDPALEDLTMLYRPLFWTSFWCESSGDVHEASPYICYRCEDWLHASNYRDGAKRVLISSASAKTAFTLAYCIRRRREKGELSADTRIVGLTSPRNLEFTRQLGLYDEVLTYDDVETLPAASDLKTIYADVAGVDALNNRIFKHFAPTNSLIAGITLGMSTIDPADAKTIGKAQREANTFSPATAHAGVRVGADMEVFFMVEWLARRRTELSVLQIVAMQKDAWDALLREGRTWVRIERVYGGPAVKRAYERLNKGGVGPDTGFIWSMWDAQEKAKL
jgi:hypothetical protein